MKTKQILISLLLFLLIFISCFRSCYCAYEYYIIADYQNGYEIPVNIETQLSITVYSSTTGQPAPNVPVTIKPQWTTPIEKYSDSNGKITFIVKPTSKGNFTITYTSTGGYFATLTTYISAKPAVMIKAEYDEIQYMDPVGKEDIIIYMRAESSEDYTIVTNPLWKIIEIKRGTTVITPNYWISSEADKYKLVISIEPRTSSTEGTYSITIQGYSTELLPIPYTFKVVLKLPAIFLNYRFATGEEITLAPHQSGTGLNVKRGCPYFDIYFYDSKGHNITVSFIYGSDMFTIIGQAGGRYTIRDNDFIYEWYTNEQKSEGMGNKLRIYFTLTETYYSMIPSIQTGISGFQPCTTELRVATISSGFNIFDFITNPYIMVPLAFVVILILFRVMSRGKKHE